MASKIVLFATLLAATKASHLSYNHFTAPLEYNSISVPTIQRYLHQSAPIVTKVLEQGPAPIYTKVHHEPIVAPVTRTHVSPLVQEYDYGYSLSDPYSANHQNKVESRRGDVVTGSYSLLEADGSKRIVDYIVTPLDGFKATVRKEAPIVAAPIAEAPVLLEKQHFAAPALEYGL
ncbi:unnamed protein product [Brassicogethes aeneus]|uniref:Uncharacterized protein n=1 Tax=Brassicogethes aeneus TaxID=1431903 RepID=A0A9P0AYW6_BRAAE|nr:unnamed protein product [Brassicogethes aeneus]